MLDDEADITVLNTRVTHQLRQSGYDCTDEEVDAWFDDAVEDEEDDNVGAVGELF